MKVTPETLTRKQILDWFVSGGRKDVVTSRTARSRASGVGGKGRRQQARERICAAINSRVKESDLASTCCEFGMSLTDDQRAKFREYADSAPERGATLRKILADCSNDEES